MGAHTWVDPAGLGHYAEGFLEVMDAHFQARGGDNEVIKSSFYKRYWHDEGLWKKIILPLMHTDFIDMT